MADLTTRRLSEPFRVARASRYTSPGDSGEALPLPFGDMTTIQGESRGVYQCPKIDTAGAGTWCVAGHAIKGSVSLFDADGLIAPGDYTLNLANDYQGQGVIATAAFSVAPNEFVEAICQGAADGAGALIENPISLAEHMMLNIWGFGGRDINQRALSLAQERALALGYKAAGVIQEDHAPQDVLQSLLGDFLASFGRDAEGRIALAMQGEETGDIHPVHFVPSREVSARRDWDIGAVVNQAPVLFGKNFSRLDGRMKRHDDGASTRDAASQVLYGARLPAAGRLELEWVRDAATARTIQARIVERLREPAPVITIADPTLRSIPVEEMDYVAFTVPWMLDNDLQPLVNQIGQVMSLGADLNAQGVTLKLRDTGYYLTTARILDGSWTLGGGEPLGGRRDTAVYA